MKTKPHFPRHLKSQLLVLLGIILVVMSASAHAEPVKGFIRAPGSYDLDGAGSKLEISRTAEGRLTTTAAWLHVGQPSYQSGNSVNTSNTWFVYVENPEMIWLFDGTNLRAFMHDAYGCGVGGVSAELFETCPQEARDALPEEVRNSIRTNTGTGRLYSMYGEAQVGVGMRLPIASGNEPPKIQAVIRASPAARAGIEPGFVLLSVDGTVTAGLSSRECNRLIRGFSGTKVTVEVLDTRSNQTKKITLERRKSIGE